MADGLPRLIFWPTLAATVEVSPADAVRIGAVGLSGLAIVQALMLLGLDRGDAERRLAALVNNQDGRLTQLNRASGEALAQALGLSRQHGRPVVLGRAEHVTHRYQHWYPLAADVLDRWRLLRGKAGSERLELKVVTDACRSAVHEIILSERDRKIASPILDALLLDALTQAASEWSVPLPTPSALACQLAGAECGVKPATVRRYLRAHSESMKSWQEKYDARRALVAYVTELEWDTHVPGDPAAHTRTAEAWRQLTDALARKADEPTVARRIGEPKHETDPALDALIRAVLDRE